MRLALLIVVGLAAIASVPRSGHALANPRLDTAVFPASEVDGPEAPLAFSRIRAAGATAVRLALMWARVAPPIRPLGFQPENPADPAYRWESFDEQVRLAKAHGLDPLVTVAVAPLWAQQGRGLPQGNVKVDPDELARFAKAAAMRYSGSFGGLPRVRHWIVWNEPNLNHYMEPVTVGSRIVAADRYRRMVNEFALAVHGVDRDNVVIAGALSPFAINAPAHKSVSPLAFMRAFLCMSRGARPKPTCRYRARFDVWAHHPYTAGGPTHHAFAKDDVSLGDLPEMRRLLLAATRARKVISRAPVRFWVTEFSWDTRPPDPHPLATPLRLHGRWVAEALYWAWRSGVDLFTWYFLRDSPYPSTAGQAGLWFYGGQTLTRDVPKPALTAFRVPFVAFRERRGVLVWGRTPRGRAASVIIEERVPVGWRQLARLRTDRHGIFTRKLPLSPAVSLRAAPSDSPAAATYREAVLADGPTAYWRLNETSGVAARDELGRNEGVYLGTPARGVRGPLAGAPDSAVAFDGVDDRVALGPVRSPRTIELWLKTREKRDVAAFSNRDALHRYVYLGGLVGLAHLYHNSEPFNLLSQNRINDNRWHHVVYTYEGLTGTVFVDGKAEMYGMWDSVEGGAAASLAYDATLKTYFRGSLDEVAIYDRALTPAEVTAHFLASGRRLAPDPELGFLRARIPATGDAALPFSLRRPPDRFVLPFAGGNP